MVRYADDFIVCFQYRDEAEAFSQALRERLARFGLNISEEKSRVIEFGRYPWEKAQRQRKRTATFDFLGFTHYGDKTRKGKFKLGRKTAKSKFSQKVKEMGEWLKSVRNTPKMNEWWEVLKQKLAGHYHYYGISGNMPQLRAFYKKALRLAYKWVNRRSQKKSYNWEQFSRYVAYNPLPEPRIYHLTYTLPRRGCILEEPNAGKLHVRLCVQQRLACSAGVSPARVGARAL